MKPQMHGARMLGLALLAAGCGLDFGDDALDGLIANRCTASSECAGEASCDTELGYCVLTPPEELRLGFEVATGSINAQTLPASYTFPRAPLDSNGQRDLALPRTQTVVGTVRSPLLTGAVPATVRFGPQTPSIESPVESSEATTSDNASRRPDGAVADYALRLVGNTVYRVDVIPAGEALRQLPPQSVDNVIVNGSGGTQRVDLSYPDVLEILEGQVFSKDAMDAESAEAGLQVRLISLSSGATVSSTALTTEDSAEGDFLLRSLPDVTADALRVGPSSLRRDFPTLTYKLEDIERSSEGQLRVEVPQFSQVPFQGTVRIEDGAVASVPSISTPETPAGDSDADTQTPAEEGFTIRLRALSLEGIDAALTPSFESIVTASTDGRFVQELLPGRYEVAVVPPDAQSAAIVVDTLDVPSDAEGEVLTRSYTLPARPSLSGTIVLPDATPGRSVPFALTPATLESIPAETRPVEDFARPVAGSADFEGRIERVTDAGRFALALQPSPSTGFPWLVLRRIEVGSEGTVLESLGLPYPFVVRGVLADEGGVLIPGAEIRAYALDDADERLLLGSATSDDEGRYTLLLAAPR